MNWEEAQNIVLLGGEADALLHINPNPEREKLYDFLMGYWKQNSQYS